MVATVIRNKSHRVFEEIDENGNGVITSDDFERIAERLIQSFGAQTSPAADKVRRTYTKCWQRLAELADSDGDGQVTKEEFETVFASAQHNKFMQVLDEALDAEFDLADSDGNGVIDREELRRMLTAYGVPQADLNQAMAALDQDGDGQVSRNEYRAAMREFYLSDDPSTPSNQIFGSLRG
jgi:Ca2+-binding EF-hand superfamily protein